MTGTLLVITLIPYKVTPNQVSRIPYRTRESSMIRTTIATIRPSNRGTVVTVRCTFVSERLIIRQPESRPAARPSRSPKGNNAVCPEPLNR